MPGFLDYGTRGKNMLKNWRIILWLTIVALSAFVIFFNAKGGFQVISSDVKEITQGDIILAINDIPASEKALAASYSGLIKIRTAKGQVFVEANHTLPFRAEKNPPTNLQFGLDIRGGVSAVIKPIEKGLSQNIIPVLEQRINFYGLREASFRTISFQGEEFVEVSIAGGTKEEITRLLEQQGKFEAKIPLKIQQSGIKLKQPHSFLIANDSLILNGVSYTPGSTLVLDGINFTFANATENEAQIVATVYGGDDIKAVYLDPTRASVLQTQNGYEWDFSLELSQEAADKFAMVTENIPLRSVGNGYLDSQISIYLDNDLINSFDISSTLKGNPATTIQISGSAATRADAIQERLEITSVLRSGSLPTSIEILQVTQISPTLGSAFIDNTILAGIAAAAGVSLIIMLRYRRPKIVLPMLIISMSEVLIILGSSVLFSWTLDLPALVGIVAALGTGVDSQVIILDQSIRKKEETLKEKLKKAFFVIFGAGGVLIVSMLPLLSISALRGFAITTVIGVLIGILITRPAFGQIVEKYIVKE